MGASVRFSRHPGTPPSRTRRAGCCLVVLALAAALTACADRDPGPSARTAPDPSPVGTAPPKVAHPMPAGVLGSDPCRALTPSQLTTLLGSPVHSGGPEPSGVANTCSWGNLDHRSLITLQFVFIWQDGLGHVYAKRNEGFFRELQPVQGFPVAAYGPDDESSLGRCGIAVGVADNAAFEVDATISLSHIGKTDPCEAARRIADAVITTLNAVTRP
ncbi:DUF3558 domain-containing protein [Amycolatopsis sp. PS_44_ISF1]|uniref:DUF3558 domain-containing protein n=1 Tax=Amycolatopsis sp. PS_44_ISF1 TaxID=2974917 RepID=UPI0028E09A0E|nr:DUF3558 domain-containing protein [Amycolatopsis sp. PS_44_ISF1]MDT8913551.1 DUF3558 domain-containing protein [Amycolatopsis sp. PS_44_ISF1]